MAELELGREDPGRDQGNMVQRRLLTASASIDIPTIGLKSVLAPV